MKGEKLTPMEEEFCRQYLFLRNGTQAAIAAGYAEKRAGATACELRAKRKIQERLEELEREWRESSEVSREQIITELKAVAFSNVQDEIEIDESAGAAGEQLTLPFGAAFIRSLPTRPRYVTAAIASIKVSKKGEVEIRRYDKNAALSKLAEIMGYTKGAGDLNVNLSITDAIAEARARARESVGPGTEAE